MEDQGDNLEENLVREGTDKKRISSVGIALTDSEKNKMLFCVLISNMICGTMILNIASFYPLYVETYYGDWINSAMVAAALGCF